MRPRPAPTCARSAQRPPRDAAVVTQTSDIVDAHPLWSEPQLVIVVAARNARARPCIDSRRGRRDEVLSSVWFRGLVAAMLLGSSLAFAQDRPVELKFGYWIPSAHALIPAISPVTLRSSPQTSCRSSSPTPYRVAERSTSGIANTRRASWWAVPSCKPRRRRSAACSHARRRSLVRPQPIPAYFPR